MESTQEGVAAARVVLGVAVRFSKCAERTGATSSGRWGMQIGSENDYLRRIPTLKRNFGRGSSIELASFTRVSMVGTLRLDSSLESVEREIPARPDTVPRLRPRCCLRSSNSIPRNMCILLFDLLRDSRRIVH